MSKPITGAQLREALGEGLDELFEEVAQAISKARPGRIIADSEEPVRDAAAVFRERLYQKALEIRQHDEEGVFSPSGAGGAATAAGQGAAGDQPSDDKRSAGDHSQGVLEQGRRKRRTGG